MSLDCVIVVKGQSSGLRGNGRPKTDLKRPVKEFLRDSNHYYEAVYRHIKECNVCDPAEALRGFLKNRKDKHRGLVSSTILKMAAKYKSHFKDRIPDSLYREFIIRHAVTDLNTLQMDIDTFSEEEVRKIHQIGVEAWRENVVDVGRKVRNYRRSKRWRQEFEDSIFRQLKITPFGHFLDRLKFSPWEPKGPRGQQLLNLVRSHTEESALQDPDPDVRRTIEELFVRSVILE